MLARPITSGSRQAPDPFDQFLESRNMYRKHTARDASCLFRVIAEQMYDTQMLHYEVRLECVRFMTRKRRIFEQVRRLYNPNEGIIICLWIIMDIILARKRRFR